MKNKILKFILIIFSFILISCMMELLFNFNILKLNEENKGIIEITDFKLENKEGKNKLTIKLNEQYVNKLVLNYSTLEDVPVDISYKGLNEYKKLENINISDRLDNEVNQQILNYKNNIKEIVYEYDEKYHIEIDGIYIDNNIKVNIFRILFVFTILSIIYLLYVIYKRGFKNKDLYKYFILFGSIIGILFIILQPSATYYSWDDQIHFKNMLELKGGNIVWNVGEFSMLDGGAIGRNSINSYEEQINQNNYLNNNNPSVYSVDAGRMISYNEISYLPMSIGYYLCKLLNLPFVVCFKISKIMNLLTYLCIFGYAIKISSVGKKILTVIGLLPSSIFLATQFSYDPAVTSGLTLAIVMLINWFTDKKYELNFKNILIFLFAICFACFTKAIYIPIILLFLLIPKEKFKNRKQEIFIKSLICILFVLIISTFLTPSTLSSTSGGDLRGGNVNVGTQLKLIMSYPFGYMNVFNDNALVGFSENIIGSGVLSNFAYIGRSSSNVYYLVLLILLFTVITDNKNNKLNKFNKFSIIFVVLSLILLIWTALYLSFTPVGETVINGVQFRYFIPLLFPLFIALQPIKLKCEIDERKYNLIFVSLIVLANILCIYSNIFTNFCI